MKRLPLVLEPVPLDLAWNDPEENLRRMEDAVVRRLDGRRADPEERLFLFPELTLTGFVTRHPKSFSLTPPDPAISRVLELARGRRTAIAFGFPERNPEAPGRPFNALVLARPDGSIAGRYRKLHLFTAGREPEDGVFSAGDRGVLCEHRGWLFGLSICFDLRFSRLYHEYARAGADVILAPACWVGGPHKSMQLRTLAAAYAVLSQAYVAAVNRSGRDPHFDYDGSAHVFSPFGEPVLQEGSCGLDESALIECRKMKVRGADRESYPLSLPRPGQT